MIVISKAKTSDAPKLSKLECTHFAESDGRLTKRAFSYHIKRNLLLVATNDHDIIGYILCLCPNKKPYARIYSLLVVPEFRGQGVARGLMDDALVQLADRYDKIFLEVRASNPRAILLYQNFGFSITRRLKGYYGKGADGIKMCKIFNYGKI